MMSAAPPTDVPLPTASARDANRAFRQIHAALRRDPPDFLRDQSGSDELRAAVWAFRDRFFEQFDADRDAKAFNHAFFLKNLYKCLLVVFAFKSLGFLEDICALDVGSGAGPFSLAWNAAFPERRSKIILFDVSSSQLESATQAFRAVELRNYSLEHADFYERTQSVRGIRLASYWVCTQQHRPPRQVSASLSHDQALIVDYPHIIESLAALMPFGSARLDLRLTGIGLPLPDPELFSDHEINVSGTLFAPSSPTSASAEEQ